MIIDDDKQDENEQILKQLQQIQTDATPPVTGHFD